MSTHQLHLINVTSHYPSPHHCRVDEHIDYSSPSRRSLAHQAKPGSPASMASRHATVGALSELMRNEPRHRVHVEGLEAHYSFPGTMSKSQRRSVVNHVEELAEQYRFSGRTAWAAIHYLDRFLSKKTDTPMKEIELFCLSCLVLASKFYETASPNLSDLCHASQDRLTREDFLRAELQILRVLEWDLAVPSPHAFLVHLIACMEVDGIKAVSGGHCLLTARAMWFVDLSAHDVLFLKAPFGAIAGAALLCALWHLQVNVRDEDIQEVEDEICSLLHCEEEVLHDTVSSLVHCYDKTVGPMNISPNSKSVFVPVTASNDTSAPRLESPDTVLAGPSELRQQVAIDYSSHSLRLKRKFDES